MTAIFTKGDVKRKFLTIESESRSDIFDLQKEIDQLESEDCLIVDVKTLKSHEIYDSLYLAQYMIEYLSPKYEVIAEYGEVYCYEEKWIGVYDDLKEVEQVKRKTAANTRVVTHSPKELEFK